MESKPSRFRRVKGAVYANIPFVLMLAVFVAGILLFFQLTQQRSAAKKAETDAIAKTATQKKKNVETVSVKPGRIVDSLILPGIVESWERVTIKSEVTGRITDILKDEGDKVSKGDIIVKVDDRDYKAALKEAKANVDLRKSDLERNTALFKKKIISQSKYDAVVAPARAAEAALDKAALNLDRTEIKASFDGIINKRHVRMGTLVVPGTEIANILDTSKVRVNVFIPERDVTKVQGLKEADIYLNDNHGIKITGKVIFLSEAPTEGAQAYELQLEVDNSKGLLRPGMFVDGNIIRGVKDAAITLPIYAIIPVGSRYYCYVENDGVAQIREVTTGIISGDLAEITSGLTVNDRVIIKGQRQLEDGELVEVTKAHNGL